MQRKLFKDHFSQHSQVYARYRPMYPRELFEHLASLVHGCELAWDCATGNGQAAYDLVEFFDRVIATDASKRQIAEAVPHEKITFLVATAEHTPLKPHSVDLITVAQAAHWLSFSDFYNEVRRVAQPHGIIALWCYGWTHIAPEIDKVLEHYRNDVVGSYWPPERHFVDEKYQTIPFPFKELHPPAFTLQKSWDMETLIGYLESWSSSRRYADVQHHDPTRLIRRELERAWGDPSVEREVRWDLNVRVGEIHSGE